MPNPFRYFNSSPEIFRTAVLMYVKYPLSLRNVEDLLAERGIDISHETVRQWWNRFGPMFAAQIRKKRIQARRGMPEWRWHLDEVFVKINGQLHYLWRAVDRRRGARGGGDQAAQSPRGVTIAQVIDEAVWSPTRDCYRPAALVRCGDGPDRQRRSA